MPLICAVGEFADRQLMGAQQELKGKCPCFAVSWGLLDCCMLVRVVCGCGPCVNRAATLPSVACRHAQRMGQLCISPCAVSAVRMQGSQIIYVHHHVSHVLCAAALQAAYSAEQADASEEVVQKVQEAALRVAELQKRQEGHRRRRLAAAIAPLLDQHVSGLGGAGACACMGAWRWNSGCHAHGGCCA